MAVYTALCDNEKPHRAHVWKTSSKTYQCWGVSGVDDYERETHLTQFLRMLDEAKVVYEHGHPLNTIIIDDANGDYVAAFFTEDGTFKHFGVNC